VYIRFEGGRPSPVVEARHELPGRYNYLIGSDPAKWQTSVPAYSEIAYLDVWDGIDLVFRNVGGMLSYELVAERGADLTQIGFTYEGVDQATYAADGACMLETSVGIVKHVIPISPGEEGHFLRVCDATSTGGSESGRDDSYSLIYSTFLGGLLEDEGLSMEVDDAGCAYVGGLTFSGDFPTTPGAFDRTYGGAPRCDAFVTKFNQIGSDLVYSTYVGGGGSDAARSMHVDDVGRVCFTGWTYWHDYPTTPGAYDQSFNTGDAGDAVVTILNATGSALEYSTFFGGTAGDWAHAIARDASGYVYITGNTHSGDLPTTPGAFDQTHGGTDFSDAFNAKIDPAGNGPADLIYSTFVGGTYNDYGYAIAVDALGQAHVGGTTGTGDFPTTPGAYDPTWQNYLDGVVYKLNASGSDLLYSTYLGTNYRDICGGDIFVDPSGVITVTGGTESTTFPTTPGAYDETHNGGWDAFISRIDPAGNGSADLLYSTYVGGTDHEECFASDIDGTGRICMTGYTHSTDFPVTPVGYDTSHNGDEDVFVATFDATITTLEYGTFLGSPEGDRGGAIVLDGLGFAYVTGYARGGAFPTTEGAYDRWIGGTQDAFVAKLLVVGATSVPGSQAHDVGESLLSLGRARPSPFCAETVMSFSVPDGSGALFAEIFDVSGRCVRHLDVSSGARTGEIIWDGRSEDGTTASSSVYFIRLRGESGEAWQKVVKLRSHGTGGVKPVCGAPCESTGPRRAWTGLITTSPQ
jgi:hypothetical protein